MYVRSIQNIVLLHIHETNPYLMTPPLPHTHNSDFKETRKTILIILIISSRNIYFFEINTE